MKGNHLREGMRKEKSREAQGKMVKWERGKGVVNNIDVNQKNRKGMQKKNCRTKKEKELVGNKTRKKKGFLYSFTEKQTEGGDCESLYVLKLSWFKGEGP